MLLLFSTSNLAKKRSCIQEESSTGSIISAIILFSQLSLNGNHHLVVFNGYRNLQDTRAASPLIICDLIKKTVQEINPLDRISNFKWSRAQTNSLYIAGAKGTDPKFHLFEYSYGMKSPISSEIIGTEVELLVILNFEIIDETTSGIRSLFVCRALTRKKRLAYSGLILSPKLAIAEFIWLRTFYRIEIKVSKD